MSPEQALARRHLVDHRTDIYSLGATLYEMFTLQPPYPGQDREELLRQITFDDPRPPRRWNPQIPADLETIVLKAMAKGVDERYATAQELAEDLRRFLEHKPIRARRPTLLERTAKLARRHKGAVATGVLLLLLLAVGFAISTTLVVREQYSTQDAFDQLAAEQQRTKAALTRAEKNFRKAREVVDFLTQVAERELANNPHMTDLRRRMLESALVYYQGFVDERQGDTSSRPDLTAAKERVTVILGELSASAGFGRAMFLTFRLRDPDVQKDLHLSEEQKNQVNELGKGSFGKLGPFGEFHQLGPRERGKKFQEMTRTIEQGLESILTADQSARFKQILLQQRGLQAMTDREVAKKLHLTASQKEKIRTIQNDAWKRMPKPPGLGGPPPRDKGKPGDFWKATNDRLLGVLTPTQQKRWDAMVGKPFHTTFRPGFGGQFGPGKRGPAPDRAGEPSPVEIPNNRRG
jgi:hypothetical protein